VEAPVSHRPWLAIFCPIFYQVGGAELVAARQAHVLRNSYATAIVTKAYCAERWQEYVRDIPVIADQYLARNATRQERRFGYEQLADFAKPVLGNFDVIIAHNFPANAVVGSCSSPQRRIWYCHEPPRWLHPEKSNPYLFRTTRGKLPLSPAARTFFEMRAASVLSKYFRTNPFAQQAKIDLEKVKFVPEIWANSEYTRDNVASVYGRRDATVVYPMVQFPCRPNRPRGIRRHDFRVLSISRLEGLKNFDTVIQGFASFHAKHPQSTLEIVGEGAAEKKLVSLTRSLGLKNAVRFHGFVPDSTIGTLAAACDAFVALPADEPFGLIFPESAALGLLLVGPSHGGPCEILENGNIGQVVDPIVPEQLADSLSRIYCMSDDEAESLREKADRSCRSRFDPLRIRDQMLQLLAKS
jgi:glycosyltransferase involved in cell wall biosynthesis